MSQQPVSRREFIRTVVLTTAALVVLPAASEAADNAAASVTYVDLGAKSQFADGWTRVVLPDKYNKEVIFVRKAAATPTDQPASPVAAKPKATPATFQAVSARCTHKGCVVGFEQDSHQFVCPCHHGRFDNNGVNVAGPPRRPLDTLATKVSAKGHLLVQAPQLTSSSDD